MMTYVRRIPRQVWALVGAVCAALAACWPQFALADCGRGLNVIEAAACNTDSAQYGFYQGIAATIWLVDRMLLSGAHWLDALRYQFIEIIFSSAYASLQTAIGPLLGPAATLALIIGAILLIAMPITGTTGPINFRVILIWALFGPLLLTFSGPLMVQFEHIRTDVGSSLFASVAGTSLGFSAARGAADMAAPSRLYPSNDCGPASNGQPLLSRYTTSTDPTIDEQVAALVWATAKDIHCPALFSDGTLPERFFVAAPDGPGYFRSGGIQDLETGERTSYIDSSKAAINRLLLAILPCVVAFLVALLNFVFACCTIILWCCIPIGVLFSFFHGNANWFADLVKRGGSILQTSWLISVLLGIFSGMLLNAGTAGDALRYAIITAISGIFVAKFTGNAFSLFSASLNTLGAATGVGGGPSFGALGKDSPKGAVTAGVGAVGMRMGAALTGKDAVAQTGSAKYATGAVMGRFKPLMGLGEVASSMSLVDDGTVDGSMFPGQRMDANKHASRQLIQTHAKHDHGTGQSLRERLDEHETDHDLQKTGQRALPGQILGSVAAGARAVKTVPEQLARGSQQAMQAAQRGRTAMVASVRAALAHPGRGGQAAERAIWNTAGGSVDAGIRAAGRVKHGAGGVQRSLAASYDRHAATGDLLFDGMWPEDVDKRNGRQHWKPRTALPVPASALPADAVTEQLDATAFRETFQQRYRVQRNADSTTTSWNTPKPQVLAKQRQSPTQQPRRTGLRLKAAATISAAAHEPQQSPKRAGRQNGPYGIDAQTAAQQTLNRVAHAPRATTLRASHQRRVQAQPTPYGKTAMPSPQPDRTMQRPRPALPTRKPMSSRAARVRPNTSRDELTRSQ